MLTNLENSTIPQTPFTAEPAESILAFPQRGVSYSTAQKLYLPVRRILDFSLALALSIIAAPVVLVAAVLVRLTSRGPAFYTQTRTGRGGRTFTIYKLRSMVDKCESLTGPRWTIPGDPRITPVGWFLRRTHIDELPQLLNVLRGEMSLIGPRPERPEFVGELENALEGYSDRHAILPGITGLAQVQLPPDTDLESVRRKLVCDLYYVQEVSLWLDVRIMVATALHMAGMPLRVLRKWRVVPTPVAAVSPAAPRRALKQAA